MTIEDDFQAELDANPEDWQCRVVFADWLEERGDPRAEGYRALGVLRRRPALTDAGGWTYWALSRAAPWSALSDAWWTAWRSVATGRDTRRQVEDAAALGFAKLPAERRAELLATRSEQPGE